MSEQLNRVDENELERRINSALKCRAAGVTVDTDAVRVLLAEVRTLRDQVARAEQQKASKR